MGEQECTCLNGPMNFSRYSRVKFIGIDKTNGRFGEVSLLQCKTCGRYWLHYLVEYEGFTGSGRWFMGLITQEIADSLSPRAAIEYLNRLDWHLYGGSYFGKKGRSVGKVHADL